MSAVLAPTSTQIPDPGLVLAKVTHHVAADLGLSGAALARIIGASEATVSRLAKGDKPLAPDSKPGELALMLVRVCRSLDALVGQDERQRRAWLGGYNRALNGVPKELIQTVAGLAAVVSYLEGMREPL